MRFRIKNTGTFRQIISVTFLGIASMLVASPNPAFAGANLAYCMASDNDVRCDFATYGQCQATVRNIAASCMINPGREVYGDSFAWAGGPAPTPVSTNLQTTSSNTSGIREMCIAQAQARYPDNGLGTASVMTQRTDVYRNCATSNGIRP